MGKESDGVSLLVSDLPDLRIHREVAKVEVGRAVIVRNWVM
jgi:hypothetical protein